ncbi:MAG: hypothetical protein EXR70_15485 [Deltaproteobacteria bacterium]|nr:hypothetical protein [Deltaproteobacteria bacterium]
MSLYQVQKLIYHVNRDAERRERYRQDATGFVKGYDLTEPEGTAILNVDVRAGKGDKDRHTMLPTAVKKPLAKHLEIIKEQHRRDLENGLGRVVLRTPWIANILTR